MSDLLNSASLVLIPSGYKEDTVYSVVPTDGSGDLSFTRASNGTRVNSAGLVEVCPWNLITYSEEFNNGSKALANATIGVDVTTAPNGTTTADSLIENGANDLHAVYNFSALTYVAGVYSLSCYVKKGARDWVRVQLYDGTNTPSVWANVNTGVLGTITGGATASIENVGNGWYRINVSSAMISASGGWAIYSSTADAQYAGYQGTNGTTALYLWGFQINNGALKPYFPTTDRLNVPRLTYQNGGGGCPSLLLEKQSTNLALYSQDFTQWTIIRASLGANTTAPNGVNDGYSIIANTTNDDHFVLQDVSVVNSTVYSYTAFLKKGNKSWARLWNTSVGYADFDLENGIVGTQSSAVGSIESFGNGWYRCCIVYTANSTGNNSHRIYTLNGDNSRIFAGDGSTINLYVFGAQVEASTYPTSYIPTTSASATRVADACFKTGISSLIGQTEGVVFVDLVMKNNISSVNRVVSITESSWISGGSIRIDIQSGNIAVDIVNGVVTIGNISVNTPFAQNTRYKIAIAYKTNDCALYMNGTQLGTNTSIGTMPTCSEFYLNELGGGFGGPWQPTEFNQAILFPTRLTNAELASLTTI